MPDEKKTPAAAPAASVPAAEVKTYPHLVARGHAVKHNGKLYTPGESVPYASDELQHAERLLKSGHLRNPAMIADVSEETAADLERQWNASQKPSDGPSIQRG